MDETRSQSPTILITGATGWLGRPLVNALIQQGYTVVALVRNRARAQTLLPSEVQFELWDGQTKPQIQAYSGVDALIHLAGESLAQWPWSKDRKAQLWKSRVDATHSLVEGIRDLAQPPKVLISASGMGYHGNAGIAPVTEDGPHGSDFLGQLAGAWEKAAFAAEALGMRVVALRFGMIVAPQGGALSALKRVFKLGLGARLGSGHQGQPWIHRDDAIGLILHAVKTKALQGSVHACAPQTPSQWDFAKTLGRVMHRPVWPWTPTWAIRLILGEFSDILLHGQYGQPLKASASGYAWRYPRLEDALRDCVSRT